MDRTKLLDRLVRQMDAGRLTHAFIIEGKRDGEKGDLATAFAKAITPFQEDIHRVYADGLSIKDQAVHDLQVRMSMKPLVGHHMVGILHDADTMTIYAQNRLLKTLEEPAGSAVYILLSENAEHLLPTVRSRCVFYHLDEEPKAAEAQYLLARDQAITFGTNLLAGRPYYMLARSLQEATSDRSLSYVFLDALEGFLRDCIIQAYGIEVAGITGQRSDLGGININAADRAVHALEEARFDLDRGINPGYALKDMALKVL